MKIWTQYVKAMFEIGINEHVDPSLENLFAELKKTICSKNGIIFTAGNGGSASTAEHFSADLSQLKKRVNFNCRSLCLNSSISLNSALSNDLSYSKALAYTLSTFSNSDCMLVTFSASGNSENIIYLHKMADSLGIPSWAFLGFDGGTILTSNQNRSILFRSPIGNYGIVENLHLTATHFLIDKLVEFFGGDN